MSYAINFTRPGMLYAAMICQSTDPLRPQLQGVQVEPCPAGGVYIVATDGHRLALGLDREATVEGGMLAGGVILPIPKGCLAKLKEGGRSAPPAVRFGAPGTFSLGGVAYPCAPIAGPFPDWRRVLPGREGLAPPSAFFDASYLADFGKIAKGFGKRTSFLRLVSADPTGPAWVDIGVPDWRGVLMPVRRSDTAPAFASFL